MAYSYEEHIMKSAGVVRVRTGLQFLSNTHLHVTQNGVKINAIWLDNVTFNVTAKVGDIIRIQRKTPSGTLYVKYTEGAPFTREVLDVQNKQFLFILQELSEGLSLDGILDMNKNRIINLGYPRQPNDAVHKAYVDTEVETVDTKVEQLGAAFREYSTKPHLTMNTGFFKFSVTPTGRLLCTYNTGEPKPPFTIRDGRLIYTID